MGDLRDYKKDLEEDLPFCRQKGFKVILVEANPEKNLIIHIMFIFQIIHKIQ